MAKVYDGWDVQDEAVGSTDFRWYKVRPGRPLHVVILSDSPSSYVGHFDKGRMHVCIGDDCRWCADQVGAQLRYCVAVAEVLTRRPGLLEVGRSVALEIRDAADRGGGLRGLSVVISKHSSSRHSRMEVEQCSESESTWWQKLTVPDVKKALFLTWEKDGIDMEEVIQEKRDKASESGKKPPKFVPPGS